MITKHNELHARIAELEAGLAWKAQWENVLKEKQELQKCCSQRGARMQIMFEQLTADAWDYLAENNDGEGWFDKDGVPK